MKIIQKTPFVLVAGVFMVIISCKENSKPQKKAKTSVDDSYVGLLNEQDMLSSPKTAQWFTSGYENYQPDASALETIKKHIKDYKIVVFMGTWCPDSHRDIPHFYSLLDQSDFNMDHLKVYALDEYKESKANYEKGYDIINVPTLIFYKDDKEVNRYVENSRESLAKDIAKIVSGRPYKNLYAE